MDTTNTATADLWDAAHTALCAKDWPAARTHLDELSTRRDNANYLSDPAAYGAPQHVADRINAVNSRVA